MSDSASDPKVEDVLSSVRRLVSGEIPRNSRASAPQEPGALVLTDADRIRKDPPARNAARSLEQRIAELEAAVDSTDDEFEPDGSEDQAQNVPDRIVYTRPPTPEELVRTRRLSEISLIPTEPVEDDEPQNVGSLAAFRHDDTASSSSKDELGASRIGHNGPPLDDDERAVEDAPMLLDVPTMPPRRGDVTAFISPDDVVERIEARIDQGEDPKAEVPIAVVSLPDAADTEAEAAENMLRDDVVVPGEPKESNDEFDAALVDAVEASVTSAVFGEIAAEAPAPLATDTSDVRDSLDTDTLDDRPTADASGVPVSLPEDAMRAMVAELMREELQGELGERITRNVRKLVRREIKRALAARDLI